MVDHRYSARVAVVAVALLFMGLVGCSDDGRSDAGPVQLDDDVVTVGSFDFPESVVLAELYSQTLERAGLRVKRSFELGPRELVAPALVQGLVEVVPEYSGTAEQFLDIGASSRQVDRLQPALAEDRNAFVVTRETARRHHLETLSDLRPLAGSLVFGGPPECPSRRLCLPGLRDTYGLRFEEFVRLDAGGEVTRQALRQGAVDVALLFSSDPSLGGQADLVELEDDRGLQPDERVTPIVNRAALSRFPGLAAALDEVSAHLTTDDLRDLNARMDGHEDAVGDIASTWLDSEEIG